MPCVNPRCADGGGAGRHFARRRGVHGFGHFGRNQSASSAGTRPGDFGCYDANGNVTATTQLLGPNTFAYDALDRLSSETITSLPYQASYDANGNRLGFTSPGFAVALGYEAATNRLAGLTVNAIPEALSLDVAGNLLTLRNGDATLTYNSANRLAQVTYLGAPLAIYAYNHAGLRTRKATPAGTLIYHYDQNGQLLMETTAQGLPLRTYIWAEQTPLAQIDLTPVGPNLIYLHTDHLDTPRAASNPAGTTVWRWAGEAFGSTNPLEDPDGDTVKTTINLRFPGQYFDAETGFFYNWNRYYDPRLGRYITSDPIGLRGGFNTYLYVNANPLKWIDPNGLEVQYCCRPAEILGGLVDHCWIKTDQNEFGMGPAGGDIPGNQYDSPYATQTQITDHTGESARPGAKCITIPDANEQCVDSKAKPGTPLGGFSATNNCTTFAGTVLGSCRTRPNLPAHFQRKNKLP